MTVLSRDIIKSYKDYKNNLEYYVMIDSAIWECLGNKYKLHFTDVSLHVNSVKVEEVGKPTFEADLLYKSDDRTSILMIEHTTKVLSKNKFCQVKAYCNVSNESLTSIIKSSVPPIVDTFLVVPYKDCKDTLKLLKKIDKLNMIKKNRGLTCWYYTSEMNKLQCFGGKFSDALSKFQVTLPSRCLGRVGILKFAPPLAILEYIVLTAFHEEYGKETRNPSEEIELTKDKVETYLVAKGIDNRKKWHEAFNIGEEIGILKNVSADQFFATINGSKFSPASIFKARQYLSDIISASEEGIDEEQSSLKEFYKEEEDYEDVLEEE